MNDIKNAIINHLSKLYNTIVGGHTVYIITDSDYYIDLKFAHEFVSIESPKIGVKFIQYSDPEFFQKLIRIIETP